MNDFPLIALSVLFPALGALIASRMGETREARRIATIAASLTVLVTTVIAVIVGQAPEHRLDEYLFNFGSLPVRWHMGADGLSAPFMVLAAVVATAVLVGAPRMSMTKRSVVSTLAMLSATIATYAALDLSLLAFFWILSGVPGALALREDTANRRVLRTYGIFILVGALPLTAAVVMIGQARSGVGHAWPFDLSDATAGVIPDAEQPLVFLMLAAALLVRNSVIPFQSWLPVLVARAPVGVSAMTVGTQMGAFLVVRVMLPLVPLACERWLPVVAVVALVSSAYMALVALVQKRVPRSLGFVLVSQLGLVVVGLASANHEGLMGAVLQMHGIALTAVGLLLLSAALQARTGTTDIHRFGGLIKRFPVLGWSFFVLVLASAGIPGSIGFVAEDLLVRGTLDHHPAMAIVALVVTVLNGITLLKLFFDIFYGPQRDAQLVHDSVLDLLPRERAAAVGLVACLAILGVAPHLLLFLGNPVISAIRF